MDDPKRGFEILINGTPRTLRVREDTASEAARLLKSRNPLDVVKIVDRSTGLKSVILPDGRLG